MDDSPPPARSARAPLRVALLVGTVYFGLAALNAWPVPVQLRTHLPHDLGDPVVTLTLLQWNTETRVFTERWWNGVGFYPLPDTMTLSDPRLGLSLLGAPVSWATGSAVAMYNVLYILSFVLSGLAAHALVFALTRTHAAAFVAGCAFAFAPFRAAHLAHLELLASYWMPVALLALHRWIEDRRAAWLALYSVSLALQGLFCAYYLPMFAVLVGAWVLWFAAGRVSVRQLAVFAAASVAGAGAMLPLFLRYRAAHEALGFARGLGEIEVYSADLAGLWAIAPELRFWPAVAAKNAEGYLFPGVTIVLLVVMLALRTRAAAQQSRRLQRARVSLLGFSAIVAGIALVALAYGPLAIELGRFTLSVTELRKPLSLVIAGLAAYTLLHPRVIAAARARSLVTFYALAAILMFAFALGPNPTVNGVKFLYRAPYWWLMSLPGFDESLRAPARFGMLAALSLSTAAGLAWWRLMGRPGRTKAIMTVALAALVTAEGWTGPGATFPVPERIAWPARCAGVPRLELPISTIEGEAAAQYRAMLSGVRSVNGTTGFVPPYMQALIAAMDARDPDALTALAEHGPLCVVVSRTARQGGAVARWAVDHPLMERLRSRTEHRYYRLHPTRAAGQAYGLTQSAALAIADARGTRGEADLHAITDAHPGTAWTVLAPRSGTDALTLSLTCSAAVSGLAISQGAYAADFARQLAVEVSSDGGTWNLAWTGTLGGRAVRAAIGDGRMVTMTLPLEQRQVRHVRLRAIGDVEQPRWSIADLAVFGTCGEPGV